MRRDLRFTIYDLRAFAFSPIVRISNRPEETKAILRKMGVKDITLENRLEVKASAEGDEYEINLIGTVGKSFWDENGITESEFRDALEEIPKGKPITITVNSEGGDVKDGLGIYDAIESRAADIKVRIAGYALSIASVFPLAAKKSNGGRGVVSPKHAIWMQHKAWAVTGGNADDKLADAEMLNAHDDTLISLYAKATKKSEDKIRDIMKRTTWTKGADAVAAGLADETEEEDTQAEASYRPLRPDYFSLCKNIPTAILNCLQGNNSAPAGAKPTETHQKKTMKKKLLALLKKRGITAGVADLAVEKLREILNALGFNITDKTTEAEVDMLIAAAKKADYDEAEADEDDGETDQPDPGPKKWKKAKKADAETDEEDATEEEDEPHKKKNKGNIVIDLTTELAQARKLRKTLQAQLDDQRRANIRAELNTLVSEGQIPANQLEDWENDAFAAVDTAEGNTVINRLKALPKNAPGTTPVRVIIGEEGLTVANLDKVVLNLGEPSRHITQNRMGNPPDEIRKALASNSRKTSQLVNSMKKFDYRNDPNGVLVGPLRDAWDAWAAGTVQNANTMSANLLRQIILSEFMRAFRREFASLELFSHNFKDVALQGTDKVEVPYYPLDTVASTEFTYANGYVVAANAQTLAKEIFVGGKGDGVASSGSGRKYKALQFTAYEIARQPWLNIAQLIVMAAEQLAIDIRADILGTRISQGKFGNAIWTGAAGGFDENVVAQYLKVAADLAFWPKSSAGRNMVLTPQYYANLASSPYVKAYLNIGSTDTIREGQIGGLYGFGKTIEDALLPVANFIRGGDGNVTNGPDLNLVGFIAFPSAILLATAPIMPGPATMRLLASYEQVTDDQSGLTFSYRYQGNLLGDADQEIIECSYGSGDGEAAALKRLTSQGV